MKIFGGTKRGVNYYDNQVTLGSLQLMVDQSAMEAGVAREVLYRANLVNVGGKFMLTADGDCKTGDVTFSNQAALVFVDAHLMAYEDFVLKPTGVCAAPFTESRAYIVSAMQSPAAAIYHRFHGMFVMEPGSSYEISESYMRFGLLDWIDRLRGVHKGRTRFTVRRLVSYDGYGVKIEDLPLERTVSGS